MLSRLASVLLLALAMAHPSAPAEAAGFGPGDGFVLDLSLLNKSMEDIFESVSDTGRIGARHFLVPVLLCQDGAQSVDVQWCTPDVPARAERIVRELKARGYGASYFPFLLCRDGTWRGQAEPKDFKKWGASYRAKLEEIFALHLRSTGDEFFLGTELSRIYLKDPAYWSGLLKEFDARTEAPVLLVANWDQWDKIPFWKDSAAIALSGYFPVAGTFSDSTDVDSLAQRWGAWRDKLVKMSRKVERPLYFAEIGYMSVGSAAKEPWAYDTDAPLDQPLQARLYEAFGRVWGAEKALARFMIWGMARAADPETDRGYSVLGKPAEPKVAEVFARRAEAAGLAKAKPVDAVFTLDDIPMWFVPDVEERLEAYARLRRAFERRGVHPIVFMNAGGLTDPALDPREVEALRDWQASGKVTFANHTARHTVLQGMDPADPGNAFYKDLDEGERLLDLYFGGWHAQGPKFFRFPNADFGPKPETSCAQLSQRGYFTLPVSFHSGDHAIAPEYHKVAAPTLDARPEGGVPARAWATRLFGEIDTQLGHARWRFKDHLAGGSALVFLFHSTRLGRDYLDHLLVSLERKGVRWVAPSDGALKAYAPAPGRCLPRCYEDRSCF